VTINSNFSWKTHIDRTISKAKHLLGFLYRVFGQCRQECLSHLYSSIVLPHLDYCSSLWDHPTSKNLHQTTGERSITSYPNCNQRLVHQPGDTQTQIAMLNLENRCHFQKLFLCKRIMHDNSIIPSTVFKRRSRPTLFTQKLNGPLLPICLHPTPQIIIPTLSCRHLEQSARYSC